MAGFVPVSHDALALCANDRERFAVFDLYQRAHRAQWVTLRLSEADMVAAWGISNHRVWALLGDLNREGLAVVIKGKARNPTTIQVLCPTAEVQRYPQRSPQGMGAEQTPTTKEVEAVPAAVQNTHIVTHACETETETETPPYRVEDTHTSPSAPGLALVKPVVSRPKADRGAFDQAAAAWKAMAPGGAKLTPERGLGKAMAGRIKDHGVEPVLRVLAWAATSEHDRAVFLRDRGLDLNTLMRPANFETYLGFATGPPPRDRIADWGYGGPPKVRTQEEIDANEAAARRLEARQQQEGRT